MVLPQKRPAVDPESFIPNKRVSPLQATPQEHQAGQFASQQPPTQEQILRRQQGINQTAPPYPPRQEQIQQHPQQIFHPTLQQPPSQEQLQRYQQIFSQSPLQPPFQEPFRHQQTFNQSPLQPPSQEQLRQHHQTFNQPPCPPLPQEQLLQYPQNQTLRHPQSQEQIQGQQQPIGQTRRQLSSQEQIQRQQQTINQTLLHSLPQERPNTNHQPPSQEQIQRQQHPSQAPRPAPSQGQPQRQQDVSQEPREAGQDGRPTQERNLGNDNSDKVGRKLFSRPVARQWAVLPVSQAFRNLSQHGGIIHHWGRPINNDLPAAKPLMLFWDSHINMISQNGHAEDTNNNLRRLKLIHSMLKLKKPAPPKVHVARGSIRPRELTVDYTELAVSKLEVVVDSQDCHFCNLKADYGVGDESVLLPQSEGPGFCTSCHVAVSSSTSSLFVTETKMQKVFFPEDAISGTIGLPLRDGHPRIPKREVKQVIDGGQVHQVEIGPLFCKGCPWRQIDINLAKICHSCLPPRIEILKHRHQKLVPNPSRDHWNGSLDSKRCMVCPNLAMYRCSGCPLLLCIDCSVSMKNSCKGSLTKLLWFYGTYRVHIRNDAFLLRDDGDGYNRVNSKETDSTEGHVA